LGRPFLIVLLSLALGLSARAQNAAQPEQPQKPYQAVRPPIPVTTPLAELPPEARKKQQGGICLVSLVVNADGKPADPHVVRCSDSIFAQNSTETVMKYRFKPAVRIADGTPIPIRISIEIVFRVGDRQPLPEELFAPSRYTFSAPPGVTSSEPDGGVYPLSNLLEAPRMTEFASKRLDVVALPFPDGISCNLVLTLDQKGKPISALVTDCDKQALQQPAIESLMQSKYKPARLNGNPVPVRMAVHLVCNGSAAQKNLGSSSPTASANP
jgi:hypothetical protein